MDNHIYFFDTTNNSFLVDGIHTIPEGAIAVSESDYQYLIDERAKGKVITVMNGTLTLTSVRPSAFHEWTGTGWEIDESGKQALLQTTKDRLLFAVIRKADEIKSGLFADYPQTEIESFYRQEREARAYVADNSTACEMLSAIATVRGIPLSILAEKVIEKADKIAAITGGIIGKRQYFETAITTANTLDELANIQAEVEKWSI